MLTRDSRDPATRPRLLLTLLAIALLCPGMHFSELDLGVLWATGSQSEMGRFVATFWPPAYGEEFLQLLWQVVGLAYFLYLGSPSSKENDDRLEAKIDELIRLQGGDRGEALIERIDRDFLRHGGHARPFGHARR